MLGKQASWFLLPRGETVFADIEMLLAVRKEVSGHGRVVVLAGRYRVAGAVSIDRARCVRPGSRPRCRALRTPK